MKLPKWIFSWWLLAVEAVGLAWISWPWVNHMVAYAWIIVTIAVLISELLNYLKTKNTWSNNVRDASIYDARRFWAMIILWLVFAVNLAIHFCSKVMEAGTP